MQVEVDGFQNYEKALGAQGEAFRVLGANKLPCGWESNRGSGVCACVCVVYQVEIDEFQNYEKALGALGEAYKVLSSDQSNSQNELKLSDLKNRMTLVKAFIDAKSYV